MDGNTWATRWFFCPCVLKSSCLGLQLGSGYMTFLNLQPFRGWCWKGGVTTVSQWVAQVKPFSRGEEWVWIPGDPLAPKALSISRPLLVLTWLCPQRWAGNLHPFTGFIRTHSAARDLSWSHKAGEAYCQHSFCILISEERFLPFKWAAAADGGGYRPRAQETSDPETCLQGGLRPQVPTLEQQWASTSSLRGTQLQHGCTWSLPWHHRGCSLFKPEGRLLAQLLARKLVKAPSFGPVSELSAPLESGVGRAVFDLVFILLPTSFPNSVLPVSPLFFISLVFSVFV